MMSLVVSCITVVMFILQLTYCIMIVNSEKSRGVTRHYKYQTKLLYKLANTILLLRPCTPALNQRR